MHSLPDKVVTLIDVLRFRATYEPDQLAYLFLADGETREIGLSYADLDQRARAIAAALQGRIAFGDRVLLLYPSGLDYISAFFGCLYAGAIAVPVFPPDVARQKPSLARIRTIARDSQASLALTTSEIFSKIETFLQLDEDFRAVDLLATDILTLEDASRWQPCEGTGETLALLQYTSGSTAAPKGVMVTHNNLLSNHRMIQAAFQHPARAPYVSWLPLFHDMGLIANVLQALYVDAPCIFMAPASFVQKPVRWLAAITRYKAHTSGGPSFAYDLCVRRITPEQRAMLDLSSWKIAFNGSEPIRWEPLRDFLKMFVPCNFEPASVYPAYGLAEATVFVSGGSKSALPVIYSAEETVSEFRQMAASHGDTETRGAFVGCGRSWLDERICIVHPGSQVVCLPEQVGEIWIAGPHVAMGYWNNQEATRQTFCAYLQTGEGPFLRTGDLGFIKDGELFITGRIKDLIIIRGLNYYPQDIEKTVEQCHPLLCVAACVAFSVPVENEERLVIVQEVERHASKEDLEEAIAEIRAQVSVVYGISTYAVVLIKPRSIPKTTSGKLQHAETRRRFLEGTLDVVCQSIADGVKSDAKRVEPQSIVSQMLRSTPAEGQRQLIEIYLQAQVARVTNRQPATIDWRQPVNSFGLDSLMYVELINQLETDLGVLLQLEQLFQDWTLPQLAETILHLFNDGSQPAPGATVELQLSQELHGMHPLSSMQQSLWYLHQLRPTSNEYHLSFAIRISGTLDVSLLERALNEIIRRHTILRAMIVEENGTPAMQIRPYEAFRLPLIECPFARESECEEAARGRAAIEARRPFDLQREPLFRFLLLQLKGNAHVLLFNVHHIIFDGWSLGVFLRELTTLYKGYAHEEAFALPPLTTHYGEFVSWQQKQLGSEEHDKHLAYWQQQLADIPALLTLPLDHPRPSIRTLHGARYSFEISPPLLEQLRHFSRQEQVTLFTTLLAAFQTLLFRYSGQTDIVVGTPVLGRTRAATRDLIGLFVNTLAIRTDFSAGSEFLALLKQVKTTLVAAYTHADVPFDTIVEAIRPERDLSYTPVFQVSFAMQNMPMPTLQAGEIIFAPTEVANESAQCDLTLSLLETPTGLLGHMDYATDLFELATIQRFARHFQTLLQAIVACPQGSISDLPLLTEEEREQVLSLWNATARSYPQQRCAHELFEEQVTRTPEAVALVFQHEQLTYSQLNARANRLSHYLQARGVGPEVLVGLLLDRSVEMVVALLAVLKAGGAYVPLDPGYPPERLNFMLQDACMPVLLTLERYRGLLPEGEEQIISLNGDWKFISDQPSTNLRNTVSAANLAYVIYTSGSTGQPKGVLVTHQGLANYLQWGLEAYTSAESRGSLVNSSLSFDLTITSLFLPLLQGQSVKLLPDEIESLATTLRSGEDFSIIKLTPTHLELLSLLLPSASLKGRASTLIIGGEALRQEHLTFWRTYAPETRLINEYGPTETVVGCCVYEVPSDAPSSGSVPIGRPIANTRCYVLDPTLQPVPVGMVGELYIGGRGLARGYWRHPALTAERFVPDPFVGTRCIASEPGARLYRTGDLARYLPDGTLQFVGRNDSQVKVRGYRIELGEIEQALLGCEGVREAVVVAREEQAGHKTLAAYVVPEREEVTADGLRQRLLERLPAYQVPAYVLLLERLPLTANGKLDRHALPAPQSVQGQDKPAVAPRTPLEEDLAAIWREVLGVANIGIYDNFLALGGHSLLATRVISQIKLTLQVEISLQSFFETQNLAELAALIAEQKSTQENLAAFEELLNEIESLSDKEVEEMHLRLVQGLTKEGSYHE